MHTRDQKGTFAGFGYFDMELSILADIIACKYQFFGCKNVGLKYPSYGIF